MTKVLMQLVAAAAALLMTGLSSAGQPAGAQRPVEYTVRLDEPQTQYVEMSMRIRGVHSPTLEVMLPVWRPGRYEVIEPSTTVSGVRARSGSGAELPMERIDKSTWMILTAAGGTDDEVVVEYRVYCNQLANRTRHVDDTHAFLSPSTVFMYAPDFRGSPLSVRIHAPDGWRIACGLEADPASPSTLLAADYDVLVDSPIEVGKHDVINFDVGGVAHQIAVWRGGNAQLGTHYDTKKLAVDFEKIIRANAAIFGSYPHSRYVFITHVYPGGRGGTEHLNSTVIQAQPSSFATAESYRRFLGLVSHEYHHTWNVKQFRPAGLKPLDGRYEYQQENYTDLLWVAEGVTSYYDDLCLARAGLMRVDDYLRALSTMIDALRNRPGAGVQSLAESSFEAWTKFNKTWADSVNTTVSFYDKGALVSLLLDMELRGRTENRVTLDAVMKELYLSFPLNGPGYTEEDVLKLVERMSGTEFRPFFKDYIRGTKQPDFESMLSVAGLELVRDRAGRRGSEASKAKAYIGVNTTAAEGLAAVGSVLADGPAYKAGVAAGDVIVALNGQRVRGSDLDSQVENLKAGDAVKLTLFRFDTLREIEFKAGEKPEGRWTLRRLKEPTEMQKAVYESWLGQKWPEGGEKKEEEEDKGEGNG